MLPAHATGGRLTLGFTGVWMLFDIFSYLFVTGIHVMSDNPQRTGLGYRHFGVSYAAKIIPAMLLAAMATAVVAMHQMRRRVEPSVVC
ncbi:MAG: hypothetical protein LW854_18125 [Rubrivivax sp.]|jgi:hypothetical protein|nr:hypothetical protein [Rubrivivax sp.]